jgi:hypothetical protein
MLREEITKPLELIQPAITRQAGAAWTAIGSTDLEQGTTVMIRALYAIVVAAIVAGAVALVPAFTSQVEASVPAALAKGDRLDIHPSCAQQSWPNIDASCLRSADDGMSVRQVRVISMDHNR